MIEAVNTLSVQSAALRASPQADAAESDVAAGSLDSGGSFVTSRIRIDNLQNAVILEYRSSDGEVLRQYPSEAQIQAFKRAQHSEATPHHTAAPAPAPQDAHTESAAPAPAPAPTASLAPAASPAPAPQASSGGDSSGGGQSVVV